MDRLPAAHAPAPRQIGEILGQLSGLAVAPLFALVSFARAARTFHPRGPTWHASVDRHPETPAELHALSERLAGRALVRFSGALWKHAERLPDVLGCAIRFRYSQGDETEPASDDQDLLFATIRRPWTMVLAPLTTRVRDYLRNDYFAVSPFDVGVRRPMYFRLHPRHVSPVARGNRSERLAIAHDASLVVECSSKPYGPWQPLADLRLERPAELDGDALRFSPFRTGRGVRPHGFIHALRRAVYEASQRARPAATVPANVVQDESG